MEIAQWEVRRVGWMWNNANIIRLKLLRDDSGGMQLRVVVMEMVAVLQLQSLSIDVASESFQNIVVVLGIQLHL